MSSLLSIFVNYSIIIFSRFTFYIIHCHFCSALFYLNNKRYSIIRDCQLLTKTRNCSLSLNYISHEKRVHFFLWEKTIYRIYSVGLLSHNSIRTETYVKTSELEKQTPKATKLWKSIKRLKEKNSGRYSESFM